MLYVQFASLIYYSASYFMSCLHKLLFSPLTHVSIRPCPDHSVIRRNAGAEAPDRKPAA